MNSRINYISKLYRLFIILVVLPFYTYGQNSQFYDLEYFTNTDTRQWTEFVKKFKESQAYNGNPIKILNIGDSHIQGGYFTNQVIALLMKDGINVDLGMTFPYSLAGTNGNENIRYYSPNKWNVTKKSKDKLPIGGYLLSCADSIIELSVKLNENEINLPNHVKLYHNPGNYSFTCNINCQIKTVQLSNELSYTEFNAVTPTDSIHFIIKTANTSKEEFKFSMIEFTSSESKLEFNSLGINGITFGKYFKSIDFMPWIKLIAPDCIIVSFGTNDIYDGKLNEKQFVAKVSLLIDSIRKQCPATAIIITAPNDHLRFKKYVNRAISPAVECLNKVAHSKDCLFWDFFSVMGGEGSSRDWYKYGWMFRDYIHLSKEGYRQQGTLFYKALMNSINKTWQNYSQSAN